MKISNFNFEIDHWKCFENCRLRIVHSAADRNGTTFIDLLVSLAIIAMLFVGIYVVYFSLVMSANNVDARVAAAAVLNQQIETIRNMPYASVGTIGGVPPGVIPQIATTTFQFYTFTLTTVVRNIDDPFDGTLGGNPSDAAPADYKLVQVTADCGQCVNFVPESVTTTVAPSHLESATQNGSLYIRTVDANGFGISGATIHVTNASVTPSIDLTDTTNASGVLQILDVPTSTGRYHITVAKSGYSSDQTYTPGMPYTNPVMPDATVVPQTITSETFPIDKLSSVTVYSSDDVCMAIKNRAFVMTGSKLIATNPDTPKFSTSSMTNGSGNVTLANIEWDAYTFAPSTSSYDVVGTIPLNPAVVDPSSSVSFRFVLAPSADPALLITITDASTGAGIANAASTLSRSGFSATQSTGHALFTETDWSGGNYTSESGVDAESVPGALVLFLNASSTYDTGVMNRLVSKTFDTGGTSGTFYALSWDPASQPPAAGANSLEFQVAANNDNATWNFVGPDGTANTYFTSSGTAIPASLAGNRYFRYEAYLTTADANTTPELDDLTVDFAGACVPPAQTLFRNLSQNTYTLDVLAPGYGEATASVSIVPGFQSAAVSLTPL